MLNACNSDTKDNISSDAVFELIDSKHSNIHFNNEIEDFVDMHINTFDYYYNGAGVAIGDINNDDLPDIFFAGNLVPNKLYLNKGNLEFEDISEQAGIADKDFWSNGVSMFDINNDGWLDIYVCHGGQESRYGDKRQNHLFINNQDDTFTEQAKEYGLVDNSFSSQAARIDFDLDGDLDLFLMNHSDFNNRFKHIRKIRKRNEAIEKLLTNPDNTYIFSNQLYINDGKNFFKRADENIGVSKGAFGLGLAIVDFNKDNRPDIYVANDFAKPDFLYYNQTNNTFQEVNKSKMGHNAQFTMGCDAVDLDNDTWVDIVNVDMTAEDRWI